MHFVTSRHNSPGRWNNTPLDWTCDQAHFLRIRRERTLFTHQDPPTPPDPNAPEMTGAVKFKGERGAPPSLAIEAALVNKIVLVALQSF